MGPLRFFVLRLHLMTKSQFSATELGPFYHGHRVRKSDPSCKVSGLLKHS